MEMAVQRYSRHTVHDVLSVHGWVAATSSSRRDHGSLLGSDVASLHGHGLVGALAALPSIQSLRPWPS
jgi:hypothetical protein